MQRPVLFRFRAAGSAESASGYTLVEILVSTALSLVLLGAVVRMFGDVGQGITNSRAMLEAADRLRLTAARLQQDLAGITVTMNPPRKPENNEGYFEYIEGPQTIPSPPGVNYAVNVDNGGAADTSVGDTDDILMFTTRSTGRPFVGRVLGKRAPLTGETPSGSDVTGPFVWVTTAQSDVAEIAWFVRGRTLYRRVLLVIPSFDSDTRTAAIDPPFSPAPAPWPVPQFYANYDLSVRLVGGSLVPNTLGDLTKRENRFAHQTGAFPFNAYALTEWPTLRLPTLCECSSPLWTAGGTLPTHGTIPQFTLTNDNTVAPMNGNSFDAWRFPLPKTELDKATGAHSYFYSPAAPASGQRIADDVILTNVIGFDVKAWDPVALAYVDMGNPSGVGTFSGNGSRVNRTDTTSSRAFLPGVYDTWSTHYETEGRWAGDSLAGRGTNGFDDAGNGTTGAPAIANGIVDDPEEMLTSPPYPIPLRGIQVKIRVFEPDSRQIREVTVVQDFLSQ